MLTMYSNRILYLYLVTWLIKLWVHGMFILRSALGVINYTVIKQSLKKNLFFLFTITHHSFYIEITCHTHHTCLRISGTPYAYTNTQTPIHIHQYTYFNTHTTTHPHIHIQPHTHPRKRKVLM